MISLVHKLPVQGHVQTAEVDAKDRYRIVAMCGPKTADAENSFFYPDDFSRLLTDEQFANDNLDSGYAPCLDCVGKS